MKPPLKIYIAGKVTGEPISLERLEARPIATMSVEAQEAHERNEKISRDQ